MTLEKMRATVGPQAPELLAGFLIRDAFHRDGLGSSDAKTSGDLGWRESTFLRHYVRCYRLSHDTYWLDKVVDHFDRMIGNLKEGPDGFRRWTETKYGVALIEAKPEANAAGMTLSPALQRPNMTAEGALVTGHRYRVELADARRVVITDLTAAQEVVTLDYQDGLEIRAIPGARLTLSGPARAGARFEVQTQTARPVDYAVHDGMVTYPVAQWIEIVRADPALRARYGKKADEYLALLDRHFRQKWEACWVELPDGAGAYTFTADPTERFPGYLLPHNQYLALARTWLVLQAIPDLPQREIYREKAEKMARSFKANLRRHENAYVWNYWDARPHEQERARPHIEDSSHATIDVGFAVEAQRRGIVFTLDDLKRMASTYVDVMWNQSRDNPLIAGRVDGERQGGRTTSEWISLAVADPRVWDVAWACCRKAGVSPMVAPEVFEVYDRLVGITAADREAIAAEMARARQFVAQGWRGNLDFELGPEGGKAPYGWTLAAWSPDGGSEWGWGDGGRTGRCLFLTGKTAPVNVVAQPSQSLALEGPTRLTLRVWYRTAGFAKPSLSLIADDKDGKRTQYEDSPVFPAAETWRQAEWQVDVKEAGSAIPTLRNRGVGTVWYDDLEIVTAARP